DPARKLAHAGGQQPRRRSRQRDCRRASLEREHDRASDECEPEHVEAVADQPAPVAVDQPSAVPPRRRDGRLARRVWRETARHRGAMLVPWGGRRERPYPKIWARLRTLPGGEQRALVAQTVLRQTRLALDDAKVDDQRSVVGAIARPVAMIGDDDVGAHEAIIKRHAEE